VTGPPVLPSIALMQPTLVSPLVSKPFHREGWVFEEKYDGWRMVAYKRGRQVQLVSRRGRDQTERFPELAAAIAALPPATLILDGEVARFDETLVSRFEWLLHRIPNGVTTPTLYMAFDCLYAAGRDLRRLALRARREWLEDVLEGQHLLFPARRLAPNGLEAWAEVLERGYEGLVAKDPASPYRGGRTHAWLKVKVPHYRAGERGWEPKAKS
jgi:bifunctional non-homologous end joining protein LigD